MIYNIYLKSKELFIYKWHFDGPKYIKKLKKIKKFIDYYFLMFYIKTNNE